MTRKSNLLKMLALAWIAGVVLAGCAERPDADEDGSSTEKFTTLTVDKWTNGEIVKQTDEQWFKFVATASKQRIYVKFSTMNSIVATLYDSDLNPVGSGLDKSGDASTTAYIEKPVNNGETYYIKVTAGNYHYDGRDSYTGKYRIGFTDFPAQPETIVTDLAKDKWADGKIESESNGGTGEQWFKFTATASTQRIYVKFSTMNCITVTLYDTSYNSIGSSLNTSGNANTTDYMEKTVTSGSIYYIKVTAGSYRYDGRDSYTGKYRIGFTGFPAQPETVITDLTEDKWASGKIESESNGGTGEQWFKFTATASTQRIYVKFSTMNCIAATLYSSDFDPEGNSLNTSGDANATDYMEKTVTSGSTYYIKVSSGSYRYDGRDSYAGTYWITFNSTGTEPTQ